MKSVQCFLLMLLLSVPAHADVIRLYKGDIKAITGPSVGACTKDLDYPDKARNVVASLDVTLSNNRVLRFEMTGHASGFADITNEAPVCEDARSNAVRGISNLAFKLHDINQADIRIVEYAGTRTCYHDALDLVVDQNNEVVSYRDKTIVVNCLK